MNFRSGRRRRTPVALDITPLIDIVFNLLIFFLITTTFVQNVQYPGIEVELPKASNAPTSTQGENVIVALTAEGRVVHEGRAMSLDELKERLEAHRRERPNALVIVQADKETEHGRVVEVMDTARAVGFSQLAIATEAEQ